MQRSDNEGGVWTPPDTATLDQASVFDSRPDRDWLNPISMSTLKRAVEKKQKKCILNGKEFTIEYGHKTRLKVSGDRPCIKVFPTDSRFLVPFGYIALETLEKFQFES